MSLTVGMYHFDCREPRALAAFWSTVLDLPMDDGATRDLAMIDFAKVSGPTWIFQRTDFRPPGRNRFGLDLSSADWHDQADRIEALGATRLGEYEVDGARWVELLDIESNLLRIFAPQTAAT